MTFAAIAVRYRRGLDWAAGVGVRGSSLFPAFFRFVRWGFLEEFGAGN